MARPTLVAHALDVLMKRIIDGVYTTEQPLPAQTELAQDLGVSRLTVREALETLRARRMVHVVHGRGTFVAPVEQWTDVNAISQAAGGDEPGGDVARHVLEVRRMIEIGAAQLCALRRDESDCAELARLIALMQQAHENDDVESFVEADVAFHDALLKGCRNPFLGIVYEPLMQILRRTRAQTSAVAAIREHAIGWHQAILDAVQAGDPETARAAMSDHMQQTDDDLHHYVLSG
ncbi:FadR/GntR family transcriptional regulator [Gephyromycinifex aptenodytis]|uniref:FadR/GntR family transcriptional regulator n=1 Tax=Gephyromycinifex aptenodytis TaxID=2716227 RepID=UPI001444C11E|nr:FadR/GntR family transcriptional regulator [Gephyromycinifex aptenodytis]